MSTVEQRLGLHLKARDVAGQRPYSVSNVRPEATVSELIRGLVSKMGLHARDSSGRPHAYHAFLEREGRHLHGSETVGEVLQNGDELVMQPDIQAGSANRR